MSAIALAIFARGLFFFCVRSGFLGIELDAVKNRANEIVISRNATGPKVMAVPTNEELMIARETARLLS